MAARLSQRLSDGTTITVRRSRTLIGTQFTEVHSVRGVHKSALLWMDGGMYALYGRGAMMRIRHPDYTMHRPRLRPDGRRSRSSSTAPKA